jgi:hypothetical protein
MKTFKHILFACLVGLLALLLIQSRYLLVKEKRLNGYFRLKEKPTIWNFSLKSWFDGTFQDDFSKRLEDHVGFRNTLFRVHNQYDYSLFGISHALGFIRGKKGVLYEEDYIYEYTGKYFIGKQVIDKKLDRLEDIYRHLASEHIPLILVFEPGKASFEPKYIPDHYRPWQRSLTNYEYMQQGLRSRHIPYLDLNRYFLEMKDTARYPLFPKYGMHWSIYGLRFAVDTLEKYIETECHTRLPAIRLLRTEVSDSLRDTDYDIGGLLNLIFPLPRTIAAYPILSVENDPGKRNLNMLVIGDSYYLNIKKKLSDQLYKKEIYWYYNSKVFPHIVDDDNPEYIDKTNLAGTLGQFNAIMLMVSEINLHCMYWNFIDDAYLSFNPGVREDSVYTIENSIRNNREWFRFVVAKARQRHLTLDRMIRKDAEYMYNLESKK